MSMAKVAISDVPDPEFEGKRVSEEQFPQLTI